MKSEDDYIKEAAKEDLIRFMTSVGQSKKTFDRKDKLNFIINVTSIGRDELDLLHELELNSLYKSAVLVKLFFKNNESKSTLWFSTSNLNLGGCSPLELIRRGRFRKLAEFIEDSLDEEI